MDIVQLHNNAGRKIEESTINIFANQLKGTLLRPGSSSYEQARKIWNGMIDKRPALIVRCANTDDVVACIRFAREHDIRAAVKGGGHNVAGFSMNDGGLIIDLSMMKSIVVNDAKKTITADAGLTLGELDKETQEYGLAVPTGVISATGISGLTLGGGFGWLSRKYGLTCDNLNSIEIVTATGEVLSSSRNQNEDLFWGIRGGGGNFGIVTSFEYQLQPVREVLGGPVFFDGKKRREVLRFYRDYLKTVPDELTTLLVSIIAPPLPFLPQHVHGKPLVAIDVCYDGSISKGELLLKPLRKFTEPIVDLIQPMPYLVHQSLNDPLEPAGFQNYWKSLYFDELSDEALNMIDFYCNSVTSPLSKIVIHQLGGVIEHIGENETAYIHRKANFAFVIASKWELKEENDLHIHWTRQFWNALTPYSIGSTYINFMGNEGEDAVKSAYGEPTYARLVTLKNKYDPTNFFRNNQNIKPTL